MRHGRWRRTAESYGTSNLLAREVASRDRIVNVFALGIIESRMVEQSCKPENIKALVPIKQAGMPQEVTYLVGSGLREGPNNISGQLIGFKR